MRRVEHTILAMVNGKLDTETHLGLFHGWGVNYEEFEAGPGNFTAGIVEDESGDVVLIHAENMKFLDGHQSDKTGK